MARPQKIGLDYFPLDVDIFVDPKVEPITARYGAAGDAILIRLLCRIYRDGYATHFDDDVAYSIARSLGDNSLFHTVSSVVNKLIQSGFFDDEFFQKFGLLSSPGIQRRYEKACTDSRRTVRAVPVEHSLLRSKPPLSHEETQQADELSSRESTQREIESKVKDIYPPIIPPQGDATDSSERLVDTKKRRTSKDLTATQLDRFEVFWAAWPNKVARGQAESTWKKYNPDSQLLSEILAGIDRAKKYDRRFKDGYMPHPSTWLNQKGWMDVFDRQDGGSNNDFKPSKGFRRVADGE